MHGFLMVAQRDIEIGDEITISYGNKDNHSMLLWYGFLLAKENEMNFCPLDLFLTEDAPAWKHQIWGPELEMEFRIKTNPS